jgi:hypothetical protein
MPVPSRFGVRARDHDLVPFAGADLVVTARAPVELHGLVGLHVAHVDGTWPVVIRLVVTRLVVIWPIVFGHRGSGSAGEEAPGDEERDHHERTHDEDDVAAALHLVSEGVQAHGDTVPAWRPLLEARCS